MITNIDKKSLFQATTSLSILLLALLLLPNSGLAHPPSGLTLDYDGSAGVLSVEIQHRVGNTSRHYIERVTVSVNGEPELEENYNEQETRSGETLTYKIPAQNGDSITVNAECNRFGDMSETIQVEGVPAESKVLLTAGLGTETEVPPVDPSTPTAASGLAIAILDVEGNTLHYSITYKGLSGQPTAAHFHSGGSGETGPPARTIFGAPEIAGVPDSAPKGTSAFITGSWTGEGEQPLTDELEEELLAGNIYVNVHTELNPRGEIRAQLERQD